MSFSGKIYLFFKKQVRRKERRNCFDKKKQKGAGDMGFEYQCQIVGIEIVMEELENFHNFRSIIDGSLAQKIAEIESTHGVICQDFRRCLLNGIGVLVIEFVGSLSK